jgi:hypothetical protein
MLSAAHHPALDAVAAGRAEEPLLLCHSGRCCSSRPVVVAPSVLLQGDTRCDDVQLSYTLHATSTVLSVFTVKQAACGISRHPKLLLLDSYIAIYIFYVSDEAVQWVETALHACPAACFACRPCMVGCGCLLA